MTNTRHNTFVKILVSDGKVYGISRNEGEPFYQTRNFSLRALKALGMGGSGNALEAKVLLEIFSDFNLLHKIVFLNIYIFTKTNKMVIFCGENIKHLFLSFS